LSKFTIRLVEKYFKINLSHLYYHHFIVKQSTIVKRLTLLVKQQ